MTGTIKQQQKTLYWIISRRGKQNGGYCFNSQRKSRAGGRFKGTMLSREAVTEDWEAAPIIF